MIEKFLDKKVDIVSSNKLNLYKWAKTWGKIQKNYYKNSVYLRREKQLEDFIKLNGFSRPFIIKDTDVLKTVVTVDDIDKADIVVVTDQKFSRYPCVEIIEQIKKLLTRCPSLLICLNRHYINIDGNYVDTSLDDSYTVAITQWLKKQLPANKIIDMSLDYIDFGDWFTWVIPDRIYYIE
jgi:hypothetical protein